MDLRGLDPRRSGKESGDDDVFRVLTIPTPAMKVSHKTRTGERREVLLKEYFITTSLIALLKRAGAEAARFNDSLKPAAVPLRIRD